jgi:putative YphP/YqiW family bacilliredoxin
MYPEELVKPMREELTSIGFKQLTDAQSVDEVLSKQKGTAFLVVNSVCGCAAGNARPGVRMALDNEKLPDAMVTVFAGQDAEATNRARSYIAGYPPSSPSMALFRDGQLVHMIPRHEIEGRMPEQIAAELKNAFNSFCE